MLNVSFFAGGGGAREDCLGNNSPGGWCLLAGDGILRSELSKVSSKCCRQLPALETLGELLAGRDLALQSGGGGDEATEDAPLRHLQSLSHWGDPGQAGRQSGHVRLHVREQFLQLVKNLQILI